MKKIHNILCESCGAGLMDVIILEPTADVDWSFLVHCDYCGGRSELVNFHGLIQVDGTQESNLLDYTPSASDEFFDVYTKKVVGVK